MVVECRLAHTIELGSHTQFVGEVVDVKVDEATLASDGTADIQKVRPLVFTPDTQAYYGIGTRMSRPDTWSGVESGSRLAPTSTRLRLATVGVFPEGSNTARTSWKTRWRLKCSRRFGTTICLDGCE